MRDWARRSLRVSNGAAVAALVAVPLADRSPTDQADLDRFYATINGGLAYFIAGIFFAILVILVLVRLNNKALKRTKRNRAMPYVLLGIGVLMALGLALPRSIYVTLPMFIAIWACWVWYLFPFVFAMRDWIVGVSIKPDTAAEAREIQERSDALDHVLDEAIEERGDVVTEL